MEGPGFSILGGEALAILITIITEHLYQVIDRQAANADWQGRYIGHLGENALVLIGEEAGIGVIGELHRRIKPRGEEMQGKDLAQATAPQVGQVWRDCERVVGSRIKTPIERERHLLLIHPGADVWNIRRKGDVILDVICRHG